MQIQDSTVLVTGANRGIGRALIDAALSKGAARVYAGTRVPFAHPDGRVVALPIDVTDDRQIAAAAARIDSEAAIASAARVSAAMAWSVARASAACAAAIT